MGGTGVAVDRVGVFVGDTGTDVGVLIGVRVGTTGVGTWIVVPVSVGTLIGVGV